MKRFALPFEPAVEPLRAVATLARPGLGAVLVATLASGVGIASYYGREFHGRPMASGALFDMNAMVAAHPTYPFGTLVRVTNLRNGRSVQVLVLDRGPAKGPQAAGVVIDLSYGAAQRLGFLEDGRTRVRLEVLRWGS